MISHDDFKKDGKIDWAALRSARIQAGEVCIRCGSMIFPAKGSAAECRSCRELVTGTSEVDHGDLIRCPACGADENVGDDGENDLFGDGEHEVTCDSCGHDYKITTHVSYTFTSPARVQPDLCPLCGEDRNHYSQRGKHSCNRTGESK